MANILFSFNIVYSVKCKSLAERMVHFFNNNKKKKMLSKKNAIKDFSNACNSVLSVYLLLLF